MAMAVALLAGGRVDPKEDMFVVFMMQAPSQRTRYRALAHRKPHRRTVAVELESRAIRNRSLIIRKSWRSPPAV
jgi:hypothetical protein